MNLVAPAVMGDGERERRDIAASLSLASAILAVARRRWPKVLVALAAMCGATALLLAAPLFSSGVIECLIGQRPQSAFPRLLGGLLCVYGCEPVFTYAFVRNACDLGEEVVGALRRNLFRALLSQRVAFFDANKASALAALLSVEIGTVRTLVTSNVSRDRGLRALTECVGTLAVLFAIAPKLAPILGAAVVLFSASTAAFNRSTGALFARDAQAGRVIVGVFWRDRGGPRPSTRAFPPGFSGRVKTVWRRRRTFRTRDVTWMCLMFCFFSVALEVVRAGTRRGVLCRGGDARGHSHREVLRRRGAVVHQVHRGGVRGVGVGGEAEQGEGGVGVRQSRVHLRLAAVSVRRRGVARQHRAGQSGFAHRVHRQGRDERIERHARVACPAGVERTPAPRLVEP